MTSADFSTLSNFLPMGVFDSLQHAARAPPPPPVALLQQQQINDLKRKASALYPHLRFEMQDAKYRIDRALKLTRIITDAENKVRVWKREMMVVQQPEAFDKALTSLYHELNFSDRMSRDRGGLRGSGRNVRRRPNPPPTQPTDSSGSSSGSDAGDGEWQPDWEEEEVVPVPDPPLVRTVTDYTDWQCSICLQDDETSVVEIACGHPYHHSCLMAYIANTAQDGRFHCAVCRQHVSAMDQPNPVEFVDQSESSSESSAPPSPSASAPASPAPASSAPASSAPASSAPASSAPASSTASASDHESCVLYGVHYNGQDCSGAVGVRFLCGHAECGDRFVHRVINDVGCGECMCFCGVERNAHDDACPAHDDDARSTTSSLGSLVDRTASAVIN